MKDECYDNNKTKKSLDDVNSYASCVHQAKKDLLNY